MQCVCYICFNGLLDFMKLDEEKKNLVCIAVILFFGKRQKISQNILVQY